MLAAVQCAVMHCFIMSSDGCGVVWWSVVPFCVMCVLGVLKCFVVLGSVV